MQRRRDSAVAEFNVLHDPHEQFLDIEHHVGSRDFSVVHIDPRSSCDVIDGAGVVVLGDDQQHGG